MAARLEGDGVPADRIRIIPIWNTDGEESPLPREENPLADALDLSGRFVVMYSGNAGLVHRFDDVLEAMARLRDRTDIVFLFAGNGPQRGRIESFARKRRLTQFRYLNYFPREQLRAWFALADVHLLTLIQDAAGVAVPSKITGAMAAGRPVLMVGPTASEPAEIILSHGMGIVIDPVLEKDRAVDRIVETILHLAAEPALHKRMGEAARHAFLQDYQHDLLCHAWLDLLTAGEGVPKASVVPQAPARAKSRFHGVDFQKA